MRNGFFAWIAAGALLALPAAAQFHHGRPGGGPPDPEMMGERLEMHAERLAAALDLTDAQRASFDALREQHLAAVRPKHEQVRAAHQALRELLEAASPDAAAVGAKAIEIHRLRGELAALREQFDSDFRATLTDAQKLALDAVRETRPGHGMRGRFGAGPGGAGPGGPGPWGAPPDEG